MFLLGCYSAAFITHLTLRDPVLPFTDFKGLLEDGSYRLGMALISAQLEYFKVSSSLADFSITGFIHFAHHKLVLQENSFSKTVVVTIHT